MTEKTENLLVRIRESERISPGDLVEKRWGDGYRREYKVKKGKEGNLSVKYHLFDKYWKTDDYPPEEFHVRWQKVTASPAVRFIELLLMKMREDSVQKRPSLLRRAIELAVEAQMRFDVDDFKTLSRHCSFYGEDEYRFVVKSGNATALAALEKRMNRTPFWYDDPASANLSQEKKRLYVDAIFKWEGLDVKVTSIKDKDNLIACHQKYEDNTWKTLRVFRISRDDLARFTDQRRKALVVGGWAFQNRPFADIDFSAIHQPTGEYVCRRCRDADKDRVYLDYSSEESTNLEQACSRCGVMLYTAPNAASRVEALEKAEAIAAAEIIDPGALARWLRHAFALADEMKYLERIIAIGEKVGVFDVKQAEES